MKTTLKRVLSMALALVLLVGALPFQASATDAEVTVTTATIHVQINNGTNGGEFSFESNNSSNTVEDVYAAYLNSSQALENTSGPVLTTYPDNQPATTVEAGKAYYLWLTWSEPVCQHNWVGTDCDAPMTCSLCGAEGEVFGHDWQDSWTYVDLQGAPSNTHWHACSRCSAKGGETAHTYTTVSDTSYHWDVCVCGATTEKTKHNEDNWHTDGTYHWHVCSCGMEFARAQHNFVDGKCDECGTAAPATTPPATSEPTTPPTYYNVYYNLNVDESKTTWLGEYPAGTSMATILNQGAIKNAKFPGLFEDWFAVEGWYLNGAKVSANDVNWSLNSNIVLYAKWYQKYNYEVVLKLYTNGNTNNVVKVIDAFKYVQDDGRLSHTEVTNIAKEYIEPNNNAGLTVYGPFDANGWEQYSLYSNRLTNTEYVTVNRNGTTVVHAMVHNAKIYNSTSSTNKKADSSNPKTGDMIMMPAAVMSVSVSALAVMFYLKKKRTV